MGHSGRDLAQRGGRLALANNNTCLESLNLSLISVSRNGRDLTQRGGRLVLADDNICLESLNLSLISVG